MVEVFKIVDEDFVRVCAGARGTEEIELVDVFRR